MLSREAALGFLKETLHIENAEKKIHNNRLIALNEIIEAHHKYVPFQSFSLIGTSLQDRKVPDLKKCINDCLCQTGGVCAILQGFFKILLQSLGFNVYFVSADLPSSSIRNSHLIIICQNVEQVGDKYYVEVGLSHPTLSAIPLYKLEDGKCLTYRFCFLEVQMKKEGTTFRRFHKHNSSDNTETDIWEEFLFFRDEEPREFSHFFKAFEEVFTDESKSVSLQNCFATLYSTEKAITVKNLLIRIWTRGKSNIKNIECKSVEEANEKVVELFPMIPVDVIRKGYIAWTDWLYRNSKVK